MKNVHRVSFVVITGIISFLCRPCLVKSSRVRYQQDNISRFHPRYFHRWHLEPETSISGREPQYPLTAAWFRDRYSFDKWNQTLDEFRAIGGDTAILRAPSIVLQSREDFIRDPDFQVRLSGCLFVRILTVYNRENITFPYIKISNLY